MALSKVALLRDAITKHVIPGMFLDFASTPSRSNASVRELARVFRGRDPRFVIAATGFHSSAHLLAMLRLGRKYVACFFGDNYPIPRPNDLYMSLVTEGAELEMWSLWSYVSALRAGALGHPYAITRSLAGTDMARELERAGVYRKIEAPDGGEPIGLVRALRPDVTFVHALLADERGTLVFGPPYSEGLWGAHAARVGVIATVERILPGSACERFADAVTFPAHRVLAVCEEPFGAHPQPLYAAPRFGGGDARADGLGYVDDFGHYELWRQLAGGGAAFAELSARVLDADDGGRAYREWVGVKRLESLAAEAREVMGAIERGARIGRVPRASTSAARPLAVRRIADLVEEADPARAGRAADLGSPRRARARERDRRRPRGARDRSAHSGEEVSRRPRGHRPSVPRGPDREAHSRRRRHRH